MKVIRDKLYSLDQDPRGPAPSQHVHVDIRDIADGMNGRHKRPNYKSTTIEHLLAELTDNQLLLAI